MCLPSTSPALKSLETQCSTSPALKSLETQCSTSPALKSLETQCSTQTTSIVTFTSIIP